LVANLGRGVSRGLGEGGGGVVGEKNLCISLFDLCISGRKIGKSVSDLCKSVKEICISLGDLYISSEEICISLKDSCYFWPM